MFVWHIALLDTAMIFFLMATGIFLNQFLAEDAATLCRLGGCADDYACLREVTIGQMLDQVFSRPAGSIVTTT